MRAWARNAREGALLDLTKRAERSASVGAIYFATDLLMVFLYTVLLARLLGRDSYGLFGAFWGLALGYFLLMDWGTTLQIVKDGACDRLSRADVLGVVSMRLIGGAIALAALVLLRDRAPSWTWAGVLFISEGIASITAVWIAVLRAKHRLWSVTLVNIIDKGGFSILIVSLAAAPAGIDLLLVSYAFLAARVGACLIGLGLCMNEVRPLPPGVGIASSVVRMYRSAGRLGTFVMVERAPSLLLPGLLAFSAGPAQAGLFQAAYKVVLVPIGLISSLSATMFPLFASSGGREQLFGIALRSALLLAGIFGMLFLTSADLIIMWAFGSEYVRGAALVLRALVPVVWLGAIWQLSIYFLCGANREDEAFRASLKGTLASCAGTALLAPFFGAAGCAVAMVIGAGFGLSQYWPDLRKSVSLSGRDFVLLLLVFGGGVALVQGGAQLLRLDAIERALVSVVFAFGGAGMLILKGRYLNEWMSARRATA